MVEALTKRARRNKDKSTRRAKNEKKVPHSSVSHSITINKSCKHTYTLVVGYYGVLFFSDNENRAVESPDS